MFAERKSVTITTDASGDGTGYIEVTHGRVLALIYTKDDYATGVDFTITAEATGETIWTESDVNASAIRYPRAALHNTDGTQYGYSGSFAVAEPVTLVKDRIKIVVANGGNAADGTFMAVIG